MKKKYVGRTNYGVPVYFVDGGVRDYDYDFLLGGHTLVYPFIGTKKRPQIWIEHTTDWYFILYHEMVELYLMSRYHFPYRLAHFFAERYETTARHAGRFAFPVRLTPGDRYASVLLRKARRVRVHKPNGFKERTTSSSLDAFASLVAYPLYT